jgi:hypothetical protein
VKTKSQDNFGLRYAAERLEAMGHGDSRFARALKAGAEGKTPSGRPLAPGQRVIIAGLKDHLAKDSPRKK